jgi:hypothetical protein
MTSGKHRKRLARQRAARTGEPYTTALLYITTEKEGPVPSSKTSSSTKVIAHCSFCGKDNTKLEKLIAGPGVYICNECVGLCDEILATTVSAEETESAVAAFEDRSADEILKVLPAIARNADSVEADLRRLVGRLRAQSTSWAVIAGRLGMADDAAQARFERS